ncbi:hypothetical protein RB979_001056 [Vibrio alginolyticus]|uniref:hypothetical protein n=1 Tax=Vibrio alginolyticus TaxID=663 RepID=UPI001DA89B33|nr:hypothetical protein [Vibrio alginolyticus]EGR2610405.1 hypothetical protein [Vibrio alginolyticus]ELA6778841.1 hypothetical protein [Vibrio alginolyticus]ELB2764900.1 hypothetical protein [Vibrio alginolyticus]EMD1211011.1 hypothetical protein [Vibrio alginolyticus]
MATAIARFIESVKLYYWFTLTDFREHLSDAYDTLLDKGEFDSHKQVSLKKDRLAVLIYCLMFPTVKRWNQDEPFVIKCV